MKWLAESKTAIKKLKKRENFTKHSDFPKVRPWGAQKIFYEAHYGF